MDQIISPSPTFCSLTRKIFFILLLGQLSFLTVWEYSCTKDEWCRHCVGRVHAKQACVCACSTAITGWKRQNYRHRHFHFFFYLVIFWYFRSTLKSVLLHSGRLAKIISTSAYKSVSVLGSYMGPSCLSICSVCSALVWNACVLAKPAGTGVTLV